MSAKRRDRSAAFWAAVGSGCPTLSNLIAGDRCLRSVGLLYEPLAGAALISRRTQDHSDLELCIAAARPAQKVADRNASQQSEPVLLDDVLTMPTLRGPVLSKPGKAEFNEASVGRGIAYIDAPSNLGSRYRQSQAAQHECDHEDIPQF